MVGPTAGSRTRGRYSLLGYTSAAVAEVPVSTDYGPDRALFGISVAAELTGVNPQTLRTYEVKGLLNPHRTGGGTRRYSGNDLEQVNKITTLLAAGLNLAGIEHVLALETETRRLQTEVDHLRARLRRDDDQTAHEDSEGRAR
jgi:MerR family transcriptional regulator/heat shock protein HspR